MAKALAYALACPIAPVDTLATRVKQAFDERPNIHTVHAALNAYRGQLFACSWDRELWQNALATGELGTNTQPSNSLIGAISDQRTLAMIR